MNVSFTGIRNASSVFYRDDKDKNVKMRVINTQLKDDIDGNDLTTYKELIKKFPMFQNHSYSNFVNITSFDNKGYYIIQLNGTQIPEADEFLPLFSFVGKLTKKISQLPNEKFAVDDKYLKSEYADRALLGNSRLSQNITPEKFNEFFNNIHKPQNVKKAASLIADDITNCMINYLG